MLSQGRVASVVAILALLSGGVATAQDVPEGDAESGEGGGELANPGADAAASLDNPGADDAEEGADADAEEPADDSIPWSLTGELASSLGIGTFVANEGANNPYLDWAVTILPAYRVTDEFKVSAALAFAQELTNSDGDTSNHRVLLSDMFLNASYSLPQIPAVEIDPSVALRLYFPTSLASQHETRIMASRISANFSRTFGDFSVGYNFGFQKNFHSYTTPVADIEDFDQSTYLFREGGNERIDAFTVAQGGNNTSYQFRNSLSLGYQPFEFLGFSISYLLVNSFRYESFPDGDSVSSTGMDIRAGVGAEEGRGRSDAYLADISAAWQIDDHFALSGGILTQGTPKHLDNDGFRFPFYDFTSEANNLTTFYLSFSGTMSGSDF